MPLGDQRVDGCFAQGGLPRGRWHELFGDGLEAETPAAATGFAVNLVRRALRDGVVVWIARRTDAYAPGLAGLGLPADRLLFIHAPGDAEALAAMEDALRTRSVDAVIGEIAAVSLVAGKRLQLACEAGGASGFVLRRQIHPRGGTPGYATAAASRWLIAPAPSETSLPGLGSPRWRVRLERCRGGRTGAWLMETDDATGDVRVVAELADHPAEPHPGAAHAEGRLRLRHGDEHRQRPAFGGG